MHTKEINAISIMVTMKRITKVDGTSKLTNGLADTTPDYSSAASNVSADAFGGHSSSPSSAVSTSFLVSSLSVSISSPCSSSSWSSCVPVRNP